MSATRPKRKRLRLDFAAIALAPVGILLIMYAQQLEGVPVQALLQGPAAMIVFGGTLGAVLLTHSLGEVREAIVASARTFQHPDDDTEALASTMVAFAIRAHRRGSAAVETELESVADPFLKEGLNQIVDDTPLTVLRETMQASSNTRRESEEAPARILEAAAGYSPTLGILGAVIGLIRVMQNLAQPEALGGGIAVAFVATLYGVGVANLVLLPLAGRLRERAARQARRREMVIQAVCSIQQRLHPRLVAQQIRTFGVAVPRIEEIAARIIRSLERDAARLPA